MTGDCGTSRTGDNIPCHNKKLKVAVDVKLTTSDVKNWLLRFSNGDVNDIQYQKEIVDVLINSVYSYDDKIVIYYNIRGKKEDITFETNTDTLNNYNINSSYSINFIQPK